MSATKEDLIRFRIVRASRLCIAVFLVISAGWLNSCKKPEGSGPAWVRQQLTLAGAYKVPSFFFTEQYDSFKVFPHVRGLFFDGLPYHGKPTRVFCWYGVPEGTVPGKKLPAVLLVHGGGGTVFPDWVKKWNDRGYIALSIALEGQVPGGRRPDAPLPLWPTHPYSGPFRVGFFEDVQTDSLQDQWFYHAVANAILANSLIRTFPEVDGSKIGITGISWGGVLVNVITGLDDRFSFCIPVYGCGYLHESPRQIAFLRSLSSYARQFYMANWEPSLYVPDQKQPSLFINGTNDCGCSLNSFIKTYHASPNEKYLRIEHNMPHGHKPGWEPSSIYYFADYITAGGEKPFSVVKTVQGRNGSVTFEHETGISEAIIYYTTDTADWGCKSYEWKKLPATLDPAGKTISGILPRGTLYFFVNGIKPSGELFSSPMERAVVFD
jgi:dienelactone hydrolase